MLGRFGDVLVRRRRLVLVATLGFVLLAGLIGGKVADRLSSGGFTDPGVESSQASQTLKQTFNQGVPNLVLVTSSPRGVDDPAAVAAGRALTARLAREQGVTQVASYWTLPTGSGLRSNDGKQALVVARITGDDDTVADRITEIGPKYTGPDGPLTVRVGGIAEVYHEVNHQIRTDLARAEAIALPATLVLLVLVFGSGMAALMPLAIAGIAVVGSFLLLTAIAAVTDVSIFALNMVTAMGLGLSIDYALFMVTRYREELRAGRDVAAAIRVTMMTAGRTVIFSSLTVGLSLAALLIFPLYFLRSFAYSGLAITALACIGAVVVLPALLAVIGHRIDRFSFRRRPPKPDGTGAWHTIALAVMRRPIPVATVVVALLVLLGLPFAGVHFGLPDDRVLPPKANAHALGDIQRTAFPGGQDNEITVVAPSAGDVAALRPQISAYASRLSSLPNVTRVQAVTGTYVHGQLAAKPDASARRFATANATWLDVVPSVYSYSGAGATLARQVRATPAPFKVQVGGQAAELIDTEHSIAKRVPLAALLIAVTTIVLLFLFTGSVVLPLKAIVLNLLSLSATFGAMVYVFQEGHLRWLVGDFTATGTLDTTTPILMFCVAFGLSMDYEVFLLSRIREQYVLTGDTRMSVATGLERTGRLITAAAALLAMVFLAFGTSSVTFIKLFGIGMAIAVMVDATLVRGALVPAFMRIAGNVNWWAPRPLRRLHDRFGVSEDVSVLAPPSTPAAEPAGVPS
jgi:RND superfamily putative drug exporter